MLLCCFLLLRCQVLECQAVVPGEAVPRQGQWSRREAQRGTGQWLQLPGGAHSSCPQQAQLGWVLPSFRANMSWSHPFPTQTWHRGAGRVLSPAQDAVAGRRKGCIPASCL